MLNGITASDFKAQYASNSPFPHIVFNDFLRSDVAEKLNAEFPSPDEDFWRVYNNPLERKLLCNQWEHMPRTIRAALEFFNSPACLSMFTELTGIEGLKADASLHGGGMHCIRRDGKLDVHIDYSIHPHLRLERRLNLLVYLNKGWQEEWGGELELWSPDMKQCIKKVAPLFNRAILFDTGDKSYHGHPEPLRCPENVARKSLAVYYLTDPRPAATERFRARFVARPQDPKDEKMEEFRRLRSGLDTGPKVYETK